MLTLEDAQRITIAARRTAAENNWNVAISVVDDGGHLIREGVYVGAIGVSGVKSSEDGIVAAAGAAALDA